MSEDTSETSGPGVLNLQEGWLVQGLHDGRIWADAAEHSAVREFALNADRTLPATAGWLALEYGRGSLISTAVRTVGLGRPQSVLCGFASGAAKSIPMAPKPSNCDHPSRPGSQLARCWRLWQSRSARSLRMVFAHACRRMRSISLKPARVTRCITRSPCWLLDSPRSVGAAAALAGGRPLRRRDHIVQRQSVCAGVVRYARLLGIYHADRWPGVSCRLGNVGRRCDARLIPAFPAGSRTYLVWRPAARPPRPTIRRSGRRPIRPSDPSRRRSCNRTGPPTSSPAAYSPEIGLSSVSSTWPRLGQDSQPAERECDAAGDGESDVGRTVERKRPVGLRRVDSLRPFAVQHGGIELPRLHGGVEFGDRLFQALHVDSQLLGEAGNRGRFSLRHLGNPVLVSKQMDDLLVEELERCPLWLAEHLAAVAGVGVVSKVGALIDKAPSVDVDDEAKGIGVLLEQVGNHPVAERRRVQVPGDGVSAAPVPVRAAPRRPTPSGFRRPCCSGCREPSPAPIPARDSGCASPGLPRSRRRRGRLRRIGHRESAPQTAPCSPSIPPRSSTSRRMAFDS